MGIFWLQKARRVYLKSITKEVESSIAFM
jgi:hypothetical protein